MENVTGGRLRWDGTGELTEQIRKTLRDRLGANFSDDQRHGSPLAPDCKVFVEVEEEKWEIHLVHQAVEGWPNTSRSWAETQVQTALLGEGILLPAGREG